MSDPVALPFRLESHDRLCFRGREYVCLRATDQGYVLRDVQGSLEETFTHERLAAIGTSPDFGHDRRFFSEGNVNARASSGVASLSDIPEDELRTIMFRYDFCIAFLKLEKAKAASRSDASMDGTDATEDAPARQGVISAIAAELAVAAAARAKLAGQEITTHKPPCGKTLRKWLTLLEDGGFQVYALRKSDRHKGNREPRLEGEVYELLAKHAREYQSEKRPTIQTQYDNLENDLKALNRQRAEAELEPLKKPSKRALDLRIKELPAFATYAARHGQDEAERFFNLVGGKPDVVRPGERVEIDEWRINLQTLFTKAGIWKSLSKEEQRLWRGRRLACVAIDVATRCILGIQISNEAHADLARKVLRMIVTDKSAVASAAGCASPWDMRCTPDLMVSDGGSAFISDLWKAAVADIGSERDVTKSKMPHLRGTIERAFRTFEINLMPRFTGRSFSSIDEKGDYDSEARASLTDDDLSRCLVRWVVDKYHNHPHDGLLGETPRNAWLRLARLWKLRPHPGRDKVLAALGVRLERDLSMDGVRFLGNHYHCREIAEEIMKRHLHPVAIRVDEGDLGRISVRIDDVWHVALCTHGGFDGVTVETWGAAMADMRRRFQDEADITRGIVLDAIADIDAIAAQAQERVEIVSLTPSPERIARIETELVRGFCVPCGPAAEGGLPVEGEAPYDARFTTGGGQGAPQGGNEEADTRSAPPIDSPDEDDFTIEDD